MNEPATEIIEAINNLRIALQKNIKEEQSISKIEVIPPVADFLQYHMRALERSGGVISFDYRKREKDTTYVCGIFDIDIHVSRSWRPPVAFHGYGEGTKRYDR